MEPGTKLFIFGTTLYLLGLFSCVVDRREHKHDLDPRDYARPQRAHRRRWWRTHRDGPEGPPNGPDVSASGPG